MQQADAWIEKGIAYTREHDLHMHRLYLESWRAVRLLLRGRWSEALELAEAIESNPERSVFNHINALTVIGRVRARRGESSTWRPLDEALELANKIGELQRLSPVCSARAEAAWLFGDPAHAAAEALPAYQLAVQKADSSLGAEPAYWLWRTGHPPAEHQRIAQPFASDIAGIGQAPPSSGTASAVHTNRRAR